jgi:hypothetical protein
MSAGSDPRGGRLVLLAATALQLLLLGTLLIHRSGSPVVFGRWSPRFAAFLAVVATAAVWSLLLLCGHAAARRLADRLRGVLEHAAVRRGALAAVALQLIVAGVGGPPETALSPELAFMLLRAAFLEIGVLLPLLPGLSVATLALSAFSLGVTLIVFEAALGRWPALLPPAVQAEVRRFDTSYYQFERPATLLGFRPRPFLQLRYRFDPEDPRIMGRYGRHMVGPRPAPEPAFDMALQTDENGFFNTPPVRGKTFDVVVLGDSFVSEYAGPGDNWIEHVRARTRRAVLNLGISSWGTAAEVGAFEAYGREAGAPLVILTYFEGNDLSDAGLFDYCVRSRLAWDECLGAGPLLRTRVLTSYLGFLATEAVVSRPRPKYPLSVDLGGRRLDLAFLDAYIARLGVSRAEVERSRGYASIRECLLRLRSAAGAKARVLLVYAPTEEHVYLALADAAAQRRALEGVVRDSIDASGNLAAGGPFRPEDLAAHIDGQRAAILALAASSGLETLDLTPRLVQEARAGRELYHYVDTHWTPEGHRVAADMLVQYLLAAGR